MCHLCFLSSQCVLSINNPILIVHHLLNNRQVSDLNRTDRYVSDCSELTTIIQMLILQSKEVPDKASEHLQEAEHSRDNQLVGLALHADIVQIDEPCESEHKVLTDGKVVVVLGRVDNSLAQESVLACVVVEEAPVHFVVPPQLVDGGAHIHDEPQIEEWILPVIFVHGAELPHEGHGASGKE